MDVDSFQKGGGKGGGKGDHRRKNPGGKGDRGPLPGTANPNKDKECFVCGRKGHLRKDCWWKDRTHKSNKGGKKGDSKNNKKGGPKGGKAANSRSLEAEPEAEHAEAFDISHLGGLVTSSEEVLEMCQLTQTSPEWDEEGWIKITLDSGCAKSAFPLDAAWRGGRDGRQTHQDEDRHW